MASINTAPMSGMRDFLPTEVLRRRYVTSVIERVYQRYGFEPLETPSLERLDTLLGKYGDEGDQLIFRILKRGDALRRVLHEEPSENSLSDGALRYDLTVPLARVVAAYRSQLPRIFKRYQIQSVYRADRPARGRFREFCQCDLDVVGGRGLIAEMEVISAVTDVLLELGFTDAGDFAIRLNHRGLLRALLEQSSIPEEFEGQALVAVDKLDKIGASGVFEELISRGIDPNAARALLQTLDSTPDGNSARLDWLAELLRDTRQGTEAVAQLRTVLAGCGHTAAGPRIRVDPYLARGLSYYTGPIFEVELSQLGVSAGGGGRYDGLVGMFSGQQIPACGFSLGLERLLLVLEERGMFPSELLGGPHALVTVSGIEQLGASIALAAALRAAGLRIELYTDLDRYGTQFQHAEKRGIRYALLVGTREVDAGVVAVRDLVEGTQFDLPLAGVPAWLQTRFATSE